MARKRGEPAIPATGKEMLEAPVYPSFPKSTPPIPKKKNDIPSKKEHEEEEKPDS